MTSNPSQVVVLTDDTHQSLLHCLSAHHRNFPEVHGEGSSPRAAAARLAELLSLTLDNAPSDWRRQSVEQAIQDVRAFAEGDNAGGNRVRLVMTSGGGNSLGSERSFEIPAGRRTVKGTSSVPRQPRGAVVLARGSGSGRFSP